MGYSIYSFDINESPDAPAVGRLQVIEDPNVRDGMVRTAKCRIATLDSIVQSIIQGYYNSTAVYCSLDTIYSYQAQRLTAVTHCPDCVEHSKKSSTLYGERCYVCSMDLIENIDEYSNA